MARPVLAWTPEKGAEIVGYLAEGVFLETAAACAGIAKITLFQWLRAGRRGQTSELATWSDEVRKAMGDAELADLRLVKAAADNGVWQAAAWRLERKYPQKYGLRGNEALIEEKVEKRLRKLLSEAKKGGRPRLRSVS